MVFLKQPCLAKEIFLRAQHFAKIFYVKTIIKGK